MEQVEDTILGEIIRSLMDLEEVLEAAFPPR
jgi:hypothetical protein